VSATTALTLRTRTAWIALATAEGVGEVTLGRLVDAYGGPVEALEAAGAIGGSDPDGQVARQLGIARRSGLAGAIRRALTDPERVEREMRSLGGWIVTPFDTAFPVRLREIDPPPAVLLGLGDPRVLADARTAAIVGTRRPTIQGRVLAARVADALTAAGVVVVSGLAVGIDGVAHAATVEGGGRTIAVVGGGLSRPGPRAHRSLAQAILRTGGAIVSELPPDQQPTRGTFPRRNRIISGLAAATIVIEAPARSGALITARHALEQGRDLLVAPGRPLDPATAGCLALLRDTPARLLVGPAEMLDDLGLVDLNASGSSVPPDVEGADDRLAPPERRVADALALGPSTIEGLARAADLPTPVVAAATTILQMRGWAHAVGPLLVPAGPLLRAVGGRR
jgi:DNA processing protein